MGSPRAVPPCLLLCPWSSRPTLSFSMPLSFLSLQRSSALPKTLKSVLHHSSLHILSYVTFHGLVLLLSLTLRFALYYALRRFCIPPHLRPLSASTCNTLYSNTIYLHHSLPSWAHCCRSPQAPSMFLGASCGPLSSPTPNNFRP